MTTASQDKGLRLRTPFAPYALLLTILIGTIWGVGSAAAQSYEEEVRSEYAKVDQAFENQLPYLEGLFEERALAFPPEEVFFRVIKFERVIEVWARAAEEEPYSWVETYAICAMSGDLGPKRHEGDLQHPEGFYRINRWNPQSSYHLSLGLDYPNESDAVLGEQGNLGGDIFIHGACGSHGCLAMTDEVVEPLFVLAAITRSEGQRRIPIHVFPVRFDEAGLEVLRAHPRADELWDFWMQLQPGYEYFEEHRHLPDIDVDATGRYALR